MDKLLGMAKSYGDVGAAVFLTVLLSWMADAYVGVMGATVLGFVGVYAYSQMNAATTLTKVLVGGLVGCAVLCLLANVAAVGVSAGLVWWAAAVVSGGVALSPLVK